MHPHPILFEEVIGEESQIEVLFQLLKGREYNISNTSLPTYSSHVKFIKNNPYRVWYLIKSNDIYIGSTYITKSNCIGISLNDYGSAFSQVVDFIIRNYKPLKEVKSVRAPNFHINIASNNIKMESALLDMGAIKIQSTYSLALIKFHS
jgi:hypothetical protein